MEEPASLPFPFSFPPLPFPFSPLLGAALTTYQPSSSSSYLFASKHNKHKHTRKQRHKHPSMLAALTTKRYNTST